MTTQLTRLTRCTREDIPTLATIRRTIEETMAAAGNSQWPLGSLPVWKIAEQVDAGEFWALRAADGTITAAVRALHSDPLIWFDDMPALYLHTLMSNPAAAAKGAGRAILAAMAQLAVTYGYDRVRLDCVGPLRGFYARQGFEDTGMTHSGNHSADMDAHLMERILLPEFTPVGEFGAVLEAAAPLV